MALKLVSGVDVWLNTPLRPREASGTSGMKAAHNGVINFSILDGWWIEGHIEGITGWSIGPKPLESSLTSTNDTVDAEDLYNKLENIIIPMYYHDRSQWIKIMKNSIGKIAYYFNSHRMMRRYVTEAYQISMLNNPKKIKTIIFDLDDTLYDCSGTLVLRGRRGLPKRLPN